MNPSAKLTGRSPGQLGSQWNHLQTLLEKNTLNNEI